MNYDNLITHIVPKLLILPGLLLIYKMRRIHKKTKTRRTLIWQLKNLIENLLKRTKQHCSSDTVCLKQTCFDENLYLLSFHNKVYWNRTEIVINRGFHEL